MLKTFYSYLTLGLPFGGLNQEIEFQSNKFAKRELLERYSRSFKDREVEETFYRYWYLIDPFPYEHPNAGTLHQGAFRTIRFAILALVLNQGVLGIQDNKFLNNTDHDNSHHLIALVLRYAVVVPAYVSAGLVMYFLGQSFYERWKSEESTPKKASSRRSSERSSSASESFGQEYVFSPSPAAFSSPMKKHTSKASIYGTYLSVLIHIMVLFMYSYSLAFKSIHLYSLISTPDTT